MTRRAADASRLKQVPKKASKKAPKKTASKKKTIRKKTARKTPKKTFNVKKISLCLMCGAPAHVGDSEESFVSLAALDPEAAVFYDRDLATSDAVVGLCGPRFRQTRGQGLFAHYGSPQGARYVVYHWDPESKSWKSFGEMRQGSVIRDGTRCVPMADVQRRAVSGVGQAPGQP